MVTLEPLGLILCPKRQSMQSAFFLCYKSESSFADTTPQALSNQKSLPLIKISSNLWAQHFSSSALTTVGYSTAQFTAHPTKETAKFYIMSVSQPPPYRLSHFFMCSTHRATRSQSALIKRMPFCLLQHISKVRHKTKTLPAAETINEGRVIS